MRAAISLADEEGIESLTMRRLGQRLGVEAMSLYNHIKNKEDVLDGMVDLIVRDIELPKEGVDWKTAMRRRAISAREVFSRHSWASRLIDSRTTPSPGRLFYFDSVIGSLREAGFSVKMAVHAFSTLDSFIYGFALQQLNLPSADETAGIAKEMLRELKIDQYPHLAEILSVYSMKPELDYEEEFEFGLDLILDGLERFRDIQASKGGYPTQSEL